MTEQHPDEGDVKDKIKKLLTAHGWFHFMPPANVYGSSGISDHLAIRKGIFLAVEAKHLKSTGTAKQNEFIENVRSHGGLGIVVNMAGLEKFERFLIEISKQYP